MSPHRIIYQLDSNRCDSSSTCAILYHLARNRYAQEKLHQELDDQLGAEDETVATGPQVKNLPYLDACINEALRIHSTSALGLPRTVPEGGLTIRGQYFPQGTVLSVPSYSIHRDTSIWGEDVEQFRPERWLEGDEAAMHKTFNPFSVGPRSVYCIIVCWGSASSLTPFIRIFFYFISLGHVLDETLLSWSFRSLLPRSCDVMTSCWRIRTLWWVLTLARLLFFFTDSFFFVAPHT